MTDDKQKRNSVAYALDILKELLDALIEDAEAAEGQRSPLAKKLRQLKEEV